MINVHDRRQFLKTFTGGILLLTRFSALASSSARASEPKPADGISRICDLAASLDIATYEWKKRGKAPEGYIKGMAVSYAKVYYDFTVANPYAIEMAKAATADPNKDALKHYEQLFRQGGMDNSKGGVDTLRHLFVLMLGLGMRESSGRYCEGRDRSADNTTSETAEAGLFQTSFNARSANQLLPRLFNDFHTDPKPTTYLDTFSVGIHAKDTDLENYGDGDGQAFQKLSKQCPFFAVEFAAIGLRNIRKHWGPINRREAEVRPAADDLFKQVQLLVDRDKLGALF